MSLDFQARPKSQAYACESSDFESTTCQRTESTDGLKLLEAYRSRILWNSHSFALLIPRCISAKLFCIVRDTYFVLILINISEENTRL